MTLSLLAFCFADGKTEASQAEEICIHITLFIMAGLGFEPCLTAAQSLNLCFFLEEGRAFGLSLEEQRPVKWSKEGVLQAGVWASADAVVHPGSGSGRPCGVA